MSELWVKTPAARLCVRERGAGHPVVLLHGGPGCPDYLAPVARLLAPTHQVISFDQRGTGRSLALGKRYDLDAYLEDLDGVLDAFDLEAVHLFGHGWGGLLAQLYAARHPERVTALFLCSPALGAARYWRRSQRDWLRAVRRRSGWSVAMRARLGGLPGGLDDALARRMVADVFREAVTEPQPAPLPDTAWLMGVSSEAMRETSRELTMSGDTLPSPWEPPFPVVVVYGERDVYPPASRKIVRRRLPAARFVIMDGAGHLPWLQNPGAFAGLLRESFDLPATQAA